MKRFIAAFVLASTALTPMLATQTASAHAPTWGIAGGQYFWYSLIEEAGHGNTVNTPAGAADISEAESPFAPVGNGASVGADSANEMLIQNYDRLDHTFTHCTAGCDGPTPTSTGALFDAALASGASAQITTIDPVTQMLPVWEPDIYKFFCKVHTWMRGSFQVT